MEVRADLHNHLTTLVEDLSSMAPKAVETARFRLGPGGILGIINAQDQGLGRYETFVRGLSGYDIRKIGNAVYVKNLDIYVVKGQEVFTQDGHLLVLGLNKGVKIQDYRSLEESLDEANKFNLAIVLDHPFFLDGVLVRNPDKIEGILKKVDGMEAHNGEAWLPIPRVFHANRNAQNFYENRGKIIPIGAMSFSDGHSLKEIGSSYTVLEQPDFSSSDKLRETLKKSIREHYDCSEDARKNSYFPALKHAAKIATLRLASKLHLFRRVN